MGTLKHVILLFVLAALCYVIAITITNSRVGFVIFLVVGLISELVFWILFWRQRRESRRPHVNNHA